MQQRNKVKDLAHPICDIFTLQFILQWEQEALSEIKTPIVREKHQRRGSTYLKAVVLQLQLPRVLFREGHSIGGMLGRRWTSDGPGAAATCKDLVALLRNRWRGRSSPDKGWGRRGMQMQRGSSPQGRKQDPALPRLPVLVFHRNLLPFP